MLQLAQNTPLPPVPYPYFQRYQIGSSVVIGYPLTNNERADLMDAGAVVLTFFEPNDRKHVEVVQNSDLVCVFQGVGLFRRDLIRANAAKIDSRRFCRVLVTHRVEALIEMLKRRKFSGKSDYVGEIAVGRA